MASVKELTKTFHKDYGDGVGGLGFVYVDMERIPTGIFEFDLSSGGGIPRGKVSIIYGPESSGKCHAAGDRVMLHDGSFRNVEDVCVGDCLMGVGNTSRKVSKIGGGFGTMYRVQPVKGTDPFTVNAEHMLSLVCTHDQGHRHKGDIVNISVKDYLLKSDDWKVYHHLYRVPVNFKKSEVPLDAQWLGLWLGDGASAGVAITTIDSEVIDYIQSFADSNGWRMSVYRATNRCSSYAVVGPKGGNRHDRGIVPRDWLERLNLLSNKHIPNVYKFNSRKVRFAILAGLLDSDGSKGSGPSACFYNTNERLCDDVVFIARSLGFFASKNPKKTSLNGVVFDSFVVYLSGDFSEVPFLLERKRPDTRKRAGSPLTSRFEIHELAEPESYYGFELDGDHLYLLDSFIVNHNTNMALRCIAEHQRLWPDLVCTFMDVEHAFDPLWAAKLGVDVDALNVFKPEYAEQVCDMVEGLLEADDCGLVVLDSVAALCTTHELSSSAEKALVGTHAQLMSKMCRKVVHAQLLASKQGSYPTLILVNQISMKIGVMFGSPETMPGGKKQLFASSMTIRIYGKNVKDESVSKTMPVLKDTSTIMKKWKVPIVSIDSKFEMCMIPHKGLKVGQSKDWGTITTHMKENGLFGKNKKGTKWEMINSDGEIIEYKTASAAKEAFYSDPELPDIVRKALIEQALEDTYGGEE